MSESFDAKLIKAGQAHTPWKGACRVVATSNIARAGLLVVDGVQLVTGDAVLCAGQTAATENGVYVAQAGAWARRVDMAVNQYWWLGTTVTVLAGTIYGGSFWALTSPSTGSVQLGVTELEFSPIVAGNERIAALEARVLALETLIVAPEDFDPALDYRGRSMHLTVPSGSGDLVLSFAYVTQLRPGCAITIFVPAGSATSLTGPGRLFDFSEPFDPDEDYVLETRAVAPTQIAWGFGYIHPPL